MKNYGQHSALLFAGIFNARLWSHRHVWTTTFRLRPAEIPKLLHKLDEGFDLVYGARNKEQHGLARNIASSGVKVADAAPRSNVPHTRSVSSFRAFRSHLMRDYPRNPPPAAFLDALLGWTAQHVTSVPVVHNPACERQVKLHLAKADPSRCGYGHEPFCRPSAGGSLARISESQCSARVSSFS